MEYRKMTPKESAQAAHLVAICSYLIMENLDGVMELNPDAAELIKKEFSTVQKVCETISTAAFGVKEVSSTTYMQDMANKINTVIRKNSKFIAEK